MKEIPYQSSGFLQRAWSAVLALNPARISRLSCGLCDFSLCSFEEEQYLQSSVKQTPRRLNICYPFIFLVHRFTFTLFENLLRAQHWVAAAFCKSLTKFVDKVFLVFLVTTS